MAGVELEDHLGDGDGFEEKAVFCIAFGGQPELRDGLDTSSGALPRFARAVRPHRVVGLDTRQLDVELGPLSVLALRDGVRRIVLELP